MTDEDLFARLPETAWTIHVGRNQSRAKYYLSNPDEMISFLAQLLELGEPEHIVEPKLRVISEKNLGMITHYLK